MQHDQQTKPDDHGLAAVCGLDDQVRRDLYEYVAGQGQPVGRDAAATAIGIGRPLAAYHLDRLVELGLLTASFRRPAGRRGPGAGRPAKLYARSGREFAVTLPPREYELAARLLAQAIEADASGVAQAALLQVAHRRGVEIGRQDSAAGDALPAVERALTEHGFEPRRDDSGSVMLRNCPFHQLAAQHKQVVCAMNLALIQGMADGLGSTALRPALEPRPERCCVVIHTSPPENAIGPQTYDTGAS